MINKWFRNPALVFALQLPFVLFFCLIILSGLFGSVYRNIGPWLVGVGWLVFITLVILFSGKTWCLICPWNAIGVWLQHGRLFGRGKAILSLNRKWAQLFRNLWLASLLFMAIIAAEYIFGVTDNPRLTAYIALIILAVTIISALLFERQSFCRYVCPVGAVSGVYSILSPLELRSRDKDVCQKCLTKDCIRGNDRGYACPVYEYPGRMDTNFYCILCTECIRTCPNSNVGFSWRSPLKEIGQATNIGQSETWLIIVMLMMSLFGALSLGPRYPEITHQLSRLSGNIHPEMLFFSIAVALAIILYLLVRLVVPVMAFGLLPLALFAHLANTLRLFNLRATEVVPLISDPFGLHWNLFGTLSYMPAPLMADPALKLWITALLAVGVLLSLFVSVRLKLALSKIVITVLFIIIIGYLNWYLI